MKPSSLAMLLLMLGPVETLAHTVPYDIKGCARTKKEAQMEGRKVCTPEDDKRSLASAFCKAALRHDPADCVESIMVNGLAQAAGRCFDQSRQYEQNRRVEISPGWKDASVLLAADGYWHTDYRFSDYDDQGWHRHGWSEAAREAAGMSHGTGQLLMAREQLNNWSVTGAPRLPSVDFQGFYEKVYAQAFADPNLSLVNTDFMCWRDQLQCSTGFSMDFKNEDYGRPRKPAPRPPQPSRKIPGPYVQSDLTSPLENCLSLAVRNAALK